MFDIRKDFPARDEHWSELKWLNCGLSFSLPLTLKRFESNGGDDENRTRDLWRDRLDVIHWRMQNQQFTRASVGHCWAYRAASGRFAHRFVHRGPPIVVQTDIAVATPAVLRS
jgi:hypothetical protein